MENTILEWRIECRIVRLFFIASKKFLFVLVFSVTRCSSPRLSASFLSFWPAYSESILGFGQEEYERSWTANRQVESGLGNKVPWLWILGAFTAFLPGNVLSPHRGPFPSKREPGTSFPAAMWIGSLLFSILKTQLLTPSRCPRPDPRISEITPSQWVHVSPGGVDSGHCSSHRQGLDHRLQVVTTKWLSLP